MSAQAQPELPADPTCWCCGRSVRESALTRLGQHPEAGVCVGCAVSLKRRATARRSTHRAGPTSRVRDGIHAVREIVIGHGWHERGVLGALLRRIDRYLP